MEMRASQKIFLAAILFSVASLGLTCYVTTRPKTLVLQIWAGVTVLLSGGAAILLFHMATQNRSKYTTVNDFIKMYFLDIFFQLFSIYSRREFENASRNPRRTQEKTLLYILRENAETEYGRKLGLGLASSAEEFRKRHPLSRYSQFEEYIERTARGEDNVLLPKRPVQLVITSGTTGKPKMIPLSKQRKLHLPLKGVSLLKSVLQDNSISLTRWCSVYTHPREFWTEAGIVKSAFTRLTKDDILPMYSTPAAGYRICSEPEAMYVHAVFALRDDTLNAIQAPFCTVICNFFKVIESCWHDIVRDISSGTIKQDLDIPSDIRSELNSELRPDPIRAEQLCQEFERGFDGIAKRVWSQLNCLYGVISPSVALYADLLENKYAKGILLHSPFYIASEGVLGVNLWPTSRERRFQYVLMTDLMFHEFIPLQNSEEDQPPALLIDEVKDGESYELAITNMDGLYRYRFGDVIKVVGFYHKTPIVEFRFRTGNLMNLRGEKVSEDCLFRAVSTVVASMEATLIDYSCAESHLVEMAEGVTEKALVPYYVLFAEIQRKHDSKEQEAEDTDKFDTILRTQVSMYDYYRKMDALMPARLIIVQPGSFNALRDYIIHNSTTAPMQFKMPRKLRTKELIQQLLKYV